MKKWGWGALGQGAITVQMAEALMGEHGTIYAVAGRRMEKVTAFASAYAVEHCCDVEGLLADEQVDIIYVATPHTYHYDYMMHALQRGKHVLCEKAVTVNHRQLQGAMALAQRKQLILMGAMTIFHIPVFTKAKELVEQSAIGRLKVIQVNFGSCREYDVTNRFLSPQLAGGTLLDIGIYALSFVRQPLHAQPDAVLTNMIPFKTGVDETSGVILRNPLDEMVMITLIMRAKLPRIGIVAGEERYLEIRGYPRADGLQIYYARGGQTETLDAGTHSDALIYELRDMEATVSAAANNSTLKLPDDVVALTDEVRRQRGMCHPFEDEETQASKKRCI